MCGIIGFNWNDEKLILKLTNLLKHRGPDSRGLYVDNNVSLGHTRLSIIDLSKKGKQPMFYKNLIITFNGEIFNFEEIKDDLKNKGYTFKSKTDTEVILLGYQEYKEKILEKLNGQFAFCIYDKKEKIFFLARDRIGINPLYYHIKNDKFLFGSELKTILKSGIHLKINEFSKDHYIVYGHCPRKETIINDTFKLEPGHFLIYDLTQKKIIKHASYWNLRFNNLIKKEQDAVKQIRKVLEESVKKRLLSDVPVGAFLSGGLDSSAVVAFASKYKKNINTFSVKFDCDEFDESKYSQEVAKLFNTKHHIVEFTAKDVKELIPRLVDQYCEPFGDSSMIPMFLVAKVARTKVTVSLSGDGSDELFGGYDSYKHYKLLQIGKIFPKIFHKVFNQMLKNIKIHHYIRAFFEINSYNDGNQYSGIMTFLRSHEILKLTNTQPELLFKKYQTGKNMRFYLNNALKTDLQNYLPEDILVKVDRASLGNSLESRPPFLDHELIELANNISASLKLKGKEGKYILKKAMKGILPKEIIYRKKKGFAVPLKHYFKNELKYIVDEINETNLKDYGLEKIDFNKYPNSHTLIWRYYMYKKWFEKWIM